MPFVKQPNAEPIRGYRLLERIGSGGFGEVWRCEAPGGIYKAIKFVYGDLNGLDNDSIRAEEELRSVQRIKSIRHPFLLSMDRVENVAGELIIISELADQNLDELLLKYRDQGLPGVPRAELLAYLREAAEVLDLMNLKFDLQHLDIKPRNLFLVSNHVKVADFGLVNSLAGANTTKLQLGAITPLYASPELFQGEISRHCDQYSLAIVFQELLTGNLPFTGKNSRQLLMQHTQGEPDLSLLPPADRPFIARALAKNPEKRFASCMDLVRALHGEIVATASPGVTGSNPDLQTTLPTQPMAETMSSIAIDIDNNEPRPPFLPENVLADYVFRESLGSTPLFDLWKVKSPTGQKRMVKLLYGLGNPTPKLKENVLCLHSLHHPALVPSEIISFEPGRLILLTDLVKETLRDRFLKCQAQKLPGIPRDELVDYMRAAAEVLDYMYQQHGVQHLGLNPRCLILDNGWLQITDFGLGQLLWMPSGQNVAERNARYAAPELFSKKITRSSDQVSLALLYAEMLTGIHPSRDRVKAPPDLTSLSPLDLKVIGRALNQDPGLRWTSCTDMVMALEGTPPEMEKENREKPEPFNTRLQMPRLSKSAPLNAVAYEELHGIIADIIAAAGGKVTPQNLEEVPELSADGLTLFHKFQTGLPLGSAQEKLVLFLKHCVGQLVREEENGCHIFIPLPSNIWGKWMGRQSGIAIGICLNRINPVSATPIAVSVILEMIHCGQKQGRKVLEEMGPGILENLRQLLLIKSNKRTLNRFLWPHEVIVTPISHDGDKEEPISCKGKDISQGGLGFYIPHELENPDILITLPESVHPGVSIPATLVRARRCADGWYDVGALFRLPALKKTAQELCEK